MKKLHALIENNSGTIGIIGLGYVGLPLAVAFAKKFKVIGYEVKPEIVAALHECQSHIIDISNEDLEQTKKNFFSTSNPEDLQKCDFIIITVPTPLTPEKTPDLKYIRSAATIIAKNLRSGQFVIMESTTYPGTTEEILVPILETSGLIAGSDFGVAYSPERIDPGNKQYNICDIPKVVGGLNDECTEIAVSLYAEIMKEVVPVKNTATAESVKMVENIFRNVNIALVNELALIFERMNINTWEVIDAAATKPYGFMPFYPGPGVGGHCIPLDPYYLSSTAKRCGFIPRFIETAGEINEYMKIHVVNLAEHGLSMVGKKLSESDVLVLGLSYKKNINDIRESPSLDIIDELYSIGASVSVYDPYVPKVQTKRGTFFSENDIIKCLQETDCVILCTDHDQLKTLDFSDCRSDVVLVDCKNCIKSTDGKLLIGIGKSSHFNRSG